jgi:Flp pilus assembly pilin Flp
MLKCFKRKMFYKLLTDETGQGLVEYSMIAIALAWVALGMIKLSRNGLSGYFNEVAGWRAGKTGMLP